MNSSRARWAVLTPVLALALAGCASPSSSITASPTTATANQSTSGAPSAATLSEPPITLRMAVADASRDPSGAAVTDFVQQVATRSGGRITIVPTFTAGHDFEVGVVDLVQHGDADLAIAASRAWDLKGDKAFEAFQTPFLIDNDALFDAVAGSDVPRHALDGLTTAVGLAMWPEDLRHPVSFARCDKDFRSPSGLAGAHFFMIPSALSYRVLEAFGAERWPTGGGLAFDREKDAAACSLHGMESGMLKVGATPMGSGPVLTANVTFWGKFQVLAANKDAFARLSPTQQAVLRDAAAAVSDAARSRRRADPALAPGWCDAGGAMNLARPDAQAAFRTAAEPVIAQLKQDGPTKQLIQAITELKATTRPSAPAQPCTASATPTPVPIDQVDTIGYVGTMPPNGTYRRELIADDLIAAGLDPKLAKGNEQVLTYTFDSGRFRSRDDVAGAVSTCEETYKSVDGQYVAGDPSGCAFTRLMWREEPDGISFVYLEPDHLPSDHILLDYWVWTRIK